MKSSPHSAIVLVGIWGSFYHHEMHGVNLGVESYFNGTCLHELSEEMVEEASRVGEEVNQGDALKQIWLDFRAWNNRHKIPCSMPQFTKSNIGGEAIR